jgi:hypothetical protein
MSVAWSRSKHKHVEGVQVAAACDCAPCSWVRCSSCSSCVRWTPAEERAAPRCSPGRSCQMRSSDGLSSDQQSSALQCKRQARAACFIAGGQHHIQEICTCGCRVMIASWLQLLCTSHCGPAHLPSGCLGSIPPHAVIAAAFATRTLCAGPRRPSRSGHRMRLWMTLSGMQGAQAGPGGCAVCLIACQTKYSSIT